MTLPNFIVVGAAKAGTTALHRYLSQHPEICLPKKKEIDYFVSTNALDLKDIEKCRKDYSSNFKSCGDAVAVGEVSPRYLADPMSAVMIKKVVPSAKIIIILRNPIDRAYSHFCMDQVGLGASKEDFEEMVETDGREPRFLSRNWTYYKNFGFYGMQVNRYIELFADRQIKIYIYEKEYGTPFFWKDLFSFLEVDTNFLPDTSERFHEGGLPRNSVSRFFYRNVVGPSILKKALKPFLSRFETAIDLKMKIQNGLSKQSRHKPALSKRCRSRLGEIYEADIAHLERLANVDLSLWRANGQLS